MRSILVCALALALAGCSGPPPTPPEPGTDRKAVPVRHDPPADLSAKFPVKDRTEIKLVPDNLLGKPLLPGGNIATYSPRAGNSYQMFLIKLKDGQAAAVLLFDLKGTLATFKFLPQFGGYYGMDGSTPLFIFQKGPYLAGISGLPEAEADLVARAFAARLN